MLEDRDSGVDVSKERLGGASQPSEGSQGDVAFISEDLLRAIDDSTAHQLSQAWGPKTNPFSQQWKQLSHHGRPLYRVLGGEVCRRFGPGSSMRLSEWNRGNLETPDRVAMIKHMIRRTRPVHLWISCECSPFCPLQGLNQKTEAQKSALEEKRRRARNQYQGAIEVAKEARRCHVEVHFELSQKCELPDIQTFVNKVQRGASYKRRK